MATANLGAAAFVYKGDWALGGGTGGNGAYKRMHVVRHNNSIWVAIVETEEEPTSTSSEWALMQANPTSGENVSFLPSGSISATNVSSAIRELDAEKAPTTHTHTSGNIISSLGYTPVQQGTGVGQLGNAVKIGWSAEGLKATVDGTDLGPIKFKHDEAVLVIDPNFNTIAPGTYHVALNTQGSAPYPSSGILEVFSIGGQVHRVQRYTTWDEFVFTRTMINNVWRPWGQIAHSRVIKTVGGQTLIGEGDIPISGGVGVGQSWQDVTSSRAINVTYTNTTGKPIAVSATILQSHAYAAFAVVGGITIASFNSIGGRVTVLFIVPNNTQYHIDTYNQETTYVDSWFELR